MAEYVIHSKDFGLATRAPVSDANPLPVMEASGYTDESGNQLTVRRAVISGATSGDNTVLSAVTGKKIRVLSLFLTSASSVAVRFESGAGGTALTGVMTVAAPVVLPPNKDGWFETAAGALLNMELGGAVQVSGGLTYVEV